MATKRLIWPPNLWRAISDQTCQWSKITCQKQWICKRTDQIYGLLRRSERPAVFPWLLQLKISSLAAFLQLWVRIRCSTQSQDSQVCNASQISAPRARPGAPSLVGGWSTPLKNDGVKVSWDDEIPNWMENKSHVPNHQPDQLWSAIKSHYAKFKEAAENTVMFPTDFGNPCPQAVRKGLRKYPLEYAKAVIQYLQQAQISVDSGPQAWDIPWTLVFL